MLLLSSAGYLGSLSSTHSVCDEDQPTPIRVEDATGVATLQAALNCAGSGEVEAEWAGYVPVGTPIEVGEGTYLSVTGADDAAEVHGVTSQSNRTRLFEVSRGGGLTLTRLKLSGGSAGTGGAVHSLDANLTLENCVFDGNVATDGSGGAVWADRGAVTIVGGEFLRNTATRYGGAVHATSSSLEVRGGSRFENNTAIGGGALFCGLSDVGSDEVPVSCFITDAEFVSNTAAYESEPDIDDDFSYLDGSGAAMFLFAIVNITDSVFLKNVAMRSGGALHGGHHTNVSVSGCKFVINNSEKFGGAISAASMTLGGGTQLTDNSALNAGGAVSADCTYSGAWCFDTFHEVLFMFSVCFRYTSIQSSVLFR